MHGGIVMTMNKKERGMKCGRIHRSRRVMLPIPAFMLLCMVFIVLAGTAAAIMPFPSSELLPVDELLSVLYAANSSHSDESCEQPNIPASVSGECGEEDSARVAEALQNFLNTGETVNLEKMLHPAHLSALREGCGRLVPTSGESKLGESIRSLLLHRIAVKLCGDGAADFYPEHVECTVVSVEKTDAEETERIIESARSNGAADACGGMSIRLAVSFLKDEKLLCFEECSLIAFESDCGCCLLPESLINVIA